MRFHLLAIGLLVALTASAGERKPPPPKFDPAFPPCVVKTVPANRAKDVDANLIEIKVTFDRPMMTKQQWSWIIHQQIGDIVLVRAFAQIRIFVLFGRPDPIQRDGVVVGCRQTHRNGRKSVG